MRETDTTEAKIRAEWLHKHKAPKDWIVLTTSEVSTIRAELTAVERECKEARDRILKLTDHGIDLMDSNRELKRKCRKAIAALREAIQFRDKTLSGYDLEEWMKAAGLKEEYK